MIVLQSLGQGLQFGRAVDGWCMRQRGQQRLGLLVLSLFYLLFQGVEVVACFLRPFSMGVFTQIVFPIFDGLAVEEELFAGQGAVEEGNGIAGILGQGLAQRLDGVAVVEGVICALSAHVISRTKVSE